MMMYRSLSATCFLSLACLLMLARPLRAQSPLEKGLRSIHRARAEAVVRFLADDELQGREAGTHGARVAARYLASLFTEAGIAPLYGQTHLQPFEAYARERQQPGRWQVEPDSIARLREGVFRRLQLSNVLGYIPGRRSNEYVVVGAHFDHLGTDPTLEGDGIYNGADDNASGVSAVWQIACAFLATGQQPLRTVVFAFWDGEEKGLLGSRHFVRTCPFAEQIKGYLNFDMIGRDNKPQQPQHVVYFHTAAHPAFGEWLRQDIERYGLQLQPDYRAWEQPTAGSDNASFARRQIPIIWYHTDAHPDYHQPSDHAHRLNWEKVVEVSKAAFLSLWHLANEPSY